MMDDLLLLLWAPLLLLDSTKKQPMSINPCKLLCTHNIRVCETARQTARVFRMLYITLYILADCVIWGRRLQHSQRSSLRFCMT